MRADRHLALEPRSGEAAVVDERSPEGALGLGGIAAEQPREPPHRPAFGGHAALPVLGKQRPQHFRFLAVEHAAPRRAFAALGNGENHAVERADILLTGLHARKNVAQVDDHGLALFRRAEELDFFELALEIGKERQQLLLGCPRGFVRRLKRQRTRGFQLEPFVADDEHGLGEIERGERGVDRQGEDAVGEPDLVVLQPVALAAEHDCDRLARRDPRRHLPHRLLGAHDGLRLIVLARGRGEHHSAVGNRALELLETLGTFEQEVGAGGGRQGARAQRILARVDEP